MFFFFNYERLSGVVQLNNLIGKNMRYWLAVLILFTLIENLVKGVIVQKVKVGENAILPCPSNDKFHRFQYWQLKDDAIIGPWNNNQEDKYRYEVWSGRLIIRSVSNVESGFYKCFSKNILGSELRSETVELLVKEDWEESFGHDSKVNAYRIVIGILVLLILTMAGIFAFFIRRRSLVFNESREGSPEELISPFDNKGVYRDTNISLTKPSTSRRKSTDRGFENAVVETDISTSFSIPNYNN